ncbi:hypothetical protein KSP40_PGU001379 [Platanthera guangdongensis]|uniref:Uncharacterized protein n=1 Tax=Platanthera guangdongensis TaxID=2320717 RepID=A0ABR2LIS1_9ASPA
MEGNSNSSPQLWLPAQKVPSFPAPSPSSGIRPWVLVLLASIFVIFIIPSFLSSNFRGFRQNFAMNGWYSLNLALIVLAILCGLLSREEGKRPAKHPYSPALEQSVYEYNESSGICGMRSSSSYPDLRQDFHAGSDWGIVENNCRFIDDIQLYRQQPSYISRRTSPPETPPASSLPSILEVVVATLHSWPPLIPPHLPPPLPVYQEEKMRGYRKRGQAAAKEIATAIALFYNKKKRGNKTKKIHDDESLPATSPSTHRPPPPPPPPPLPPLSSSIFSQIFTQRRGGSKCKRFNTIPAIRYSLPPPPPPPPAFRRSKKGNLLFPDPPLPRSQPIQPPLRPPPSLTCPRSPRRKRNKRPAFLQTY